MSLQAQLKAARAEANKHQFGTPAWESAMAKVRALVEQVNASAAPFVYTSREGDVFSV